MDLNLVHLTFPLTIDGTVSDRFSLFGLRRVFPDELRRATCGKTNACGECREAPICNWFHLFGQPIPSDPEALKRHQKPPLPFIFDIPLITTRNAVSADVEVGLTLAGTAVNHVGYFITALEKVFARSLGWCGLAVSLDGMCSCGLFGEKGTVGSLKRGEMPRELRILAADDIAAGMSRCGSIVLSLVTPLRMLREGRLLRTFDPPAFIRGLVRRVSSLVAIYGGGEIDANFRWLSERSRDVYLEGATFDFCLGDGPATGGIVGKGILAGSLEPFLPYLFLGEYLHAGKGASWGFGRYRLDGDAE